MAVKGSNDFDPDPHEEKIETSSRTGTIRKVLHSLVGTDSLLNKSVKMLDRPAAKSSASDTESYSNYFREYAIFSEYNSVSERRIPGVYVIPSAKSELVWFGVLFVRSGMYKGGVFRFILNIPESFPDCSHPRLFFEFKVFHPSVDIGTAELNLKSVFAHWTKGVNHIWQVLDYTRSIFYQIPVKSTTNRIASQLYESDKEKFLSEVRACVERSQEEMCREGREPAPGVEHVEDEHYLRFGEYVEEVHGDTLKALKTSKPKKTTQEGSTRHGLSWIKPGSFKPCSAAPYF